MRLSLRPLASSSLRPLEVQSDFLRVKATRTHRTTAKVRMTALIPPAMMGPLGWTDRLLRRGKVSLGRGG